MMNIRQMLEERLIRYVSVNTQSNARNTVIPSSPGQTILAEMLFNELNNLGVKDVQINSNGIVTACIPGLKTVPKIGFVAHLDTVDIGMAPDINVQKIHYHGQDVLLNQDQGIFFDKKNHPELERYIDDDIFFSDGTSVLGADNKAAITIMMSAVETILRDGEPHGDLYIAFVPDEEIGLRGSKLLDLTRFSPDYAYTIDSCERGEVVWETFNAGTAVIKIQGITAHPMSAKGVLVNPILIAADYMALFDRQETPEHTDGRDGYIWFNQIAGGQSSVTLQAAIRDHDLSRYQARKQQLEQAVATIQRQYPRAQVTIEIEDVYENIGNHVTVAHPAIASLYQAMQELRIPPKTIAMRGGTDGSALSAKGLVTPNYFTGAHNFHSVYEFLPMRSLVDSFNLTLTLIRNAAKSDQQ